MQYEGDGLRIWIAKVEDLEKLWHLSQSCHNDVQPINL